MAVHFAYYTYLVFRVFGVSKLYKSNTVKIFNSSIMFYLLIVLWLAKTEL